MKHDITNKALRLHIPKLVQLLHNSGNMRHDKVMAPRNDSPKDMALAADERQPITRIVVGANQLVRLGKDDGRRTPFPLRQPLPLLMLLCKRRIPNTRHEGRHEALVIVHHPPHVVQDPLLQRRLLAGQILGLGNGQHTSGLGPGSPRRRNGPLQPLSGEDGKNALGDEAAREDEAADGPKGRGLDEARRREQHQRRHHVREGIGKGNDDAAAQRIPN